MYYLLSFGLIIFGLIGLYGSIFKYTKEQHKNAKFTSSGQGFDGLLLAILMELFPWWIGKIILILSSALAVFIGIMILITM
jgi:O-antigen/teichoic acid export membrane protein